MVCSYWPCLHFHQICIQDGILSNEIRPLLAYFKYHVYNNTVYILHIMYYVNSVITSNMPVFEVTAYLYCFLYRFITYLCFLYYIYLWILHPLIFRHD